MQTTIRINPMQSCISNQALYDTQICAGIKEKPVHDSCEGDSGGPLVMRNAINSRYYLAGIVR
jgi:secreted trypsin-like serine protease